MRHRLRAGEERAVVTAERLLGQLAAIVLAFAISPIVGFVGSIAWYEAGGKDSPGIAGLIVGVAFFALMVWKGRLLLQKTFMVMRIRLPEPLASCTLFGVAGSVLLGGGMAAGILLLGHMRPEGWDFNRIPLWMGVGFVIFAFAGYLVGRRKQRAIFRV